MARIDREELRRLIRDVLKEAVSAGLVPPPSRNSAGESPSADSTSAARTGTPSLPPRSPSPDRQGALRIDSGVLTEAMVVALARTHRKILVGSDVVMTPLARDKAREMKVELVRQKP
jgi:hypothetical protein